MDLVTAVLHGCSQNAQAQPTEVWEQFPLTAEILRDAALKVQVFEDSFTSFSLP